MKRLSIPNPTTSFHSTLFTFCFLIFFGSLAFANDCENLQVNGTNTSIKVSGLTAPIEIVKIYKTVDDQWELIYECSANCEPELALDDLTEGTYHVDLQSFDANWQALCQKTISVTVGGCACDAVYEPVCGVDGNTYGNRCEADCAGVDIIAEGECAPVTTCDLLARITFNTDLCSQCLSEIAVYSYEDKSYLVYLAQNITCADMPNRVVDCDTGEDFCTDGGLLASTCGDFFEKAEKIETVLEDDCTPCICPAVYAPVCGEDGVTYGNECEAACEGVEIAAEGECEPCICPEIYAPVCGEDGNTYDNECFAVCAGIEVVAEGECTTVTTCELLARITLNPNLCEQCLTEVSVYTLEEKNYLAFIAQNSTCADGQTRVLDCETGEEFCVVGGITGINTCEDFFQKGEKTEVVLSEDCTPCFCPAVYDPVCGEDGKTYGNACEAECAGVAVEAVGECPCICPAVALPVCGVDGKTYINACKAACAGIEVAFEGTCEECLGEPLEGVACPAIFEPVCGCNGITYSNACEAEVAGIKNWTEGPCPDPNECIGTPLTEVACPAVYIPVCGCDGVTYGNACEAQVAGIKDWKEGACDDSEDCVGPPNLIILCSPEPDPVCGCDGKTYLNACAAQQVGVRNWTEGACPDRDECKGEANPLILCTTEYAPVCGCDGVTYSNACVAEASGIKKWEEGACPCACPEIWAPVCGVDGKTYGNECEAICAGVEIASEGECETENDCSDQDCDLLARILLNPNLCEDCLTEVATYCYRGENYLVFLGDFLHCEDAKTTVFSCATGDTFCELGGDQLGLPCGNFFEEATKLETILTDDCEDDCQGLPTPGAPCPEIYKPVCGCDGETYENECMAQSLGIKQWTEGECNMAMIECGEITIAYGYGKIKMTGQPDKSYFFKVHDQLNDWEEIFDCSSDCGSEQTANLPQGKYYLKVYNSDWVRVCEQEVILRDENEPENGRFECGDATVTFGLGKVRFEGEAGKNYHLKILDEAYYDVFACMWECGNVIETKDISSGRYLIRGMDAEYNILCEQWVSIGSSFNIRTTPELNYTVYPNPADNEIFFRLRETNKVNGTLQIVNGLGQIMDTQNFEDTYGEAIRVDLSDYQNGLYYYQIKVPAQPIISGKFLVNRLY